MHAILSTIFCDSLCSGPRRFKWLIGTVGRNELVQRKFLISDS